MVFDDGNVKGKVEEEEQRRLTGENERRKRKVWQNIQQMGCHKRDSFRISLWESENKI